MTPSTTQTVPDTAPEIRAARAPGAALWRRARLWLVVVAVLAAGAVLVGVVTTSPQRPLDPSSAAPSGSEALAHVLAGYGVRVHRATSMPAAGSGAVLVTAPDDYSAAQLRQLARGAALLILVRPSTRTLSALPGSAQPDESAVPDPDPGCSDAGADAAGELDLPGDAIAYTGGATTCYGGLLSVTGTVAVLGSEDLLRNDHLAGDGVAALDVNVLTRGRTLTTLTWLLPGSDADGAGPTSVWDLFPRGTYRAFWWLAGTGLVLLLWGVRRLGRPVPEPLPVVVRAAELVEGHGRLHARAGARDRTSAALRDATVARLRSRLGLGSGAPAADVATAAAARTARPAADIAALLGGAVPADDDALVRLARDLDRLEGEVSP